MCKRTEIHTKMCIKELTSTYILQKYAKEFTIMKQVLEVRKSSKKYAIVCQGCSNMQKYTKPLLSTLNKVL